MRSSNLLVNRVESLHKILNHQLGTNKKTSIGIVDLNQKLLRSRYYGGELTDDFPEIFIPEKLEKLLSPKRYKIIYGGRASTKTTTFAALITELIRYYGKNIMCCREVFKSIRESTHKCIANEVDRRNLRGEEISVTNIDISSLTSPGIATFNRLKDNPETIKGSEGIDIVWVDEAENISLMSWTVLRPTLRKKNSEIWISFNPRFENDPTWTEFVQPYLDKMVDGIYEDDKYLIISTNYTDNPWLSKESIDEMETMKERDYDRYLWQWEGLFNKRSSVQIMHGKWVIEPFKGKKEWEGPYFGADFGFSQDPSTLIKMWINEDILYIEYESYGVGIDLDDMPEFYDQVPGARDDLIYGDCSRPETISHLNAKGFYMKGAKKWNGSVEDGITYLRGLKKIIIHPRCTHTVQEFDLYSYKVHKLTDEILADVEDSNNHCIDAIRYGLDGVIQNRYSFWTI